MDDLEKKLKEFKHNLKERVKELGCLYAISGITAIPNIPITDVLKETIKIIPPAWQYPEITKARITYDKSEYKSENFMESEWKLDAQININSTSLLIEVFLLEEKLFLDEEVNLIKDIALRLKNFIEQSENKQEISLRDKITEMFHKFPDDQMYPEVLEILLEVLESKMGYFGYIDENGDMITPSLTRDIYWEKCEIPDKGILYKKKSWAGAWGESLRQKKTVISNGPFKFPEGHIVLTNVMCVPIFYQSEVIGQLTLGNKITGYTKWDQRLVETIANHISPILHARLDRDKMEKERKRMEQELKYSKRDREKVQEELDGIDKKILTELFKDGKKGLKQFELFKSKVMSHTGIKNRISNLINSNVLKIQGNININELNYNLAFLLIELRKFEQLKRFIEYYSKCKRVFFVLTVSGKYHLLIGIVGKSFEAINNFVSYCSLVNDTDVAKSKLIFGSNLELPEFLPINLFGKKQEDFNCERLCEECDYFKEGLCIGCE
ncbi:hypothetical protein LCGC14_1095160 [marine sediment metagenome]|uniref:GAF domain-containing protein n=1 Tax=marine sediment metagenome TaxID=412755 RepID=A0A0F9MB67_9ZZZZ|nr:MAG: hypothetical protein Lokiarch_50160 [Candidatus Lokiarchaeum sp. GC14_75]